ncbi:MAG: hypothetical protein A4E55_00788 [Pelotomaculum sp. PtaU1.Bin035]|nr:MAG: hypothetical protein A4E55_00788 [Pelotomaculum sp. PtaU1.Bin035]
MDKLAVFKKAKNYALYYGTGKEEKLAAFDVVIVEPSVYNEDSLKRIKDSGTLVLAYLSVMELRPAAPEIRLLKDADFLNIAGRQLINEEYGNYLLDLRSNRWRGLLSHRAGSLMENSGYDGLFLDTIGDIESVSIASKVRDSLMMAAVNIISQLKNNFPNSILIQNCGLEILCTLTSRLINGICWENPPLAKKTSRQWVNAVTSRLTHLRDRHGLKILLLVEENRETYSDTGDFNMDSYFQAARKIAVSNGFLLYRAPFCYVGGVNSPCNIPEN